MIAQTLLLASEAEGVAPTHIASKIAVPLGILIFCGSVFVLLWSNYGAKKGALIYSTAFFGFCFVLGVFWWFGAPGTPVATGLQNFPGQAPDAYQGRWYGFEPGSERASFFPSSNSLEGFESIEEYAGQTDPEHPRLSAIRGDLDQAQAIMLSQWLPTDESGGLRIGANRRQELQQAAGDPRDGESRADPFLTAEVSDIRVTDDGGIRVAGATITTFANFTGGPDGPRQVEVEQGNWFAFKDPGALWFPSAVWTLVSLVLFVVSLFGLDLVERGEKRRRAEVEEPEDLAVPIAQ